MKAFETILAPMEGVTNFVIRDYFSKNTCVDLVSTEFVRVSVGGLSPKVIAREVIKQEGKPLSVQLMGNNPYEMAEAARLVNQCNVDVIDINLGCPSRCASRSGVGAKLLQTPSLIYEIVSRMRDNITCLQSAKIRAGFDNSDNSDNIFNIVEQLEKAAVDFIIVHPRRRIDFYKGKADWQIIDKIKKHVNIPVIGNGDIWSAQDAIDMLAETGADGVMLGRGALRNPWIFEQIMSLRRGEKAEDVTGKQLIGYIDDLILAYAENLDLTGNKVLRKLKELIHWIMVGIDNGAELKKKLLRLQELEEFREEFSKTFLSKKVI